MTETLNRYGSLCAEIYDLDKPAGALHDVAYYTERLGHIGRPVLEAAVGTGRLLIPLLQAGIDAAGFDHSADMLAICQGRCTERGLFPELRRARFQDFAFDRTFGAVIVPVSSFIFVDDFAEAMSVLRRFRAALAPGGTLMVDLPPLSYLTDDADGVRTWTAANGDLLRLEARRIRLDVAAQASLSHDRYERWRDGRLLESQLEVMSVRLWGRHEFEMALREAGFTNVAVGANYGAGTGRPRILNYTAINPG